MCTLTYLPLKDEFIFTSNRDEHESRANTLFPVKEKRGDQLVYFPQDPIAGGTWLAVSNAQKLAVLLNGAYKAHKHHPPYRKSRGIVLLDLFDHESLEAFYNNYDFTEIEPFTIVDFDYTNPDSLFELRWDGIQKHFTTLDGRKAQIWSSSQLYNSEIREQREKWFEDLLVEEPNAETLSHFHEFGGKASLRDTIKMDRGNGLRTISISQLIFSKEKTKFNYRNLVSNTNDTEWIDKKGK